MTAARPPSDDPSGLGLSYDQLTAVAARALGHEARDDAGTGGLALPPDSTSLAEAREMVARAIRRFVAEKVDWTFLSQTLSVTFAPEGDGPLNVSADAARYRMPWWFGGKTESDFYYTTASAPALSIRIVEPREIAAAQAAVSGAGDPLAVAFRRLAQSATGGAAAWEAVFDPAPSRALTVECQARAYPRAMVSGDDCFFAGLEFNNALERLVELECAERKAEMDLIPLKNAVYERALEQAKQIDNASKPRRAGRLTRVMTLDRDSDDERPNIGATGYLDGVRISN